MNVTTTAAAAATYTNTTGNLFVGTLDTGKAATAGLTVSAAPPAPACIPDTVMAQWTFTGFASNPPPFPAANTQAENVTTAAISVGNNLVAVPDGSSGSALLPSMQLYGWPKLGPVDFTTSPYVQFAVDTSKYSSVQLQFNAIRKQPGPDNVFVYYSTDRTTWNLMGTLVPSPSLWTSYGPYLAPLSSLTGPTYFRLYGYGVNNPGGTGQDLSLDDVTFKGCYVPPPTLIKAFAPDPVAVGGISTLKFTLSNDNLVALTGVKFTDALPSGVQVAATPKASTTCGTGTWAPLAGAMTLTFGNPTGGTIPARVGTVNGTCTAQVDVVVNTAGPHQNISGAISSAESGANNTATGYGSDSVTALLPPAIAKQFVPSPVVAGGTSTLTFVLTNPNQNNALSSVAFADTFPTMPGAMVVANPPNASTLGSCGTPLFAPSAGAGTISFSGGMIAGGGTCTVKVDVTAPTAGTYANTSGAVSALINDQTVTGNTASASLTMTQPRPAIALLKQVSTSQYGPWSSYQAVAAGAAVYYRFTVENTGDVPLSPVSVSDPTLTNTPADPAGCTWPSPLPVGSPTVDPTATCVRGPVTATAGSHPNTATANGAYGSTPVTSAPSTATYATTALTLVKSVAQTAYAATGDNLTYSYRVTNNGTVPLAGPVTVKDTRVAVVCPAGGGDGILDPGESVTCTSTYTVIADDMALKSVTNLAWANAGGVTSNTASVTIKPVPAAVTLDAMVATVRGDAIEVTWHTATELNNRGFNLWRGTSSAGPDVRLNEYLIPSQSQGSTEGFTYIWEDRQDLVSGTTYWYWVETVDSNAALTRHGPTSVAFGDPGPTAVVLSGLSAATTAATAPALAGLGGLAVLVLAGSARRRRGD